MFVKRHASFTAFAVLMGFHVALSTSAGQVAAPPGEKVETPRSKLTIGDLAPKLEVETYLKGDPITEYEKGKTYVVEFWATWCGPCRDAFPHLSQLQKQYRDKGLKIVGVDTWETNEADYTPQLFDHVKSFVQAQGEKMDYAVAYDGRAMKATRAFMEATEQDGVPVSFVVDGQGRIAWIGHPMELGDVVEQVVAGKWDVAKAKADHERRRELERKAQALYERVSEAAYQGQWDQALAALDEIKKLDEKQFAFVDLEKFQLLLMNAKQYDRAYAMKDVLLKNKTVMEDAETLNALAWMVVDPNAEVEKRDVEFARVFADKANERAQGKDPAILDTLARVHWLKGDKAKAVELQEKAVSLCADDDPLKDDLQSVLNEYKQGMP